MRLAIDHVTQHGNAARNDCGAACVAMLAGVSVDEVLAALQQPQDRPLHLVADRPGSLQAALRLFGLGARFGYMTPLQIRESVRGGRPVICLVDYGKLPAAQRAEAAGDFAGAHFVLVVGADAAALLVHDPLALDGPARWPDGVMEAAQRGTPGTSYDYQALMALGTWPVVDEISGLMEEAARTIRALIQELERARRGLRPE